MEKSGHICPHCRSKEVHCEGYADNINGIFLFRYKCLDCKIIFESKPSHQEAEDEK